MPIRIKICGITSANDAQVAVAAGAHALGFMFYPESPRNVTADQAAEIIQTLPPFIAKVGVFVNANLETVLSKTRESGLDTVQLHGDESPGVCADIRKTGCKCIKALRIRDRSSLEMLPDYKNHVDAFLLDSYVAGQHGGTGEIFNWNLAVEAKHCGVPIILAGGLKSDNVSKAVNQVAPFGLDVSSGVEVEGCPGKKDAKKIRSFMANAMTPDGGLPS